MQKDYSVLRWPCPEWFHVPLINEWEWILSIVHNLWISEWYDTKQALKLPNTWCRWTDWVLTNQWWLSIYVCSNWNNWGTCTRLSMDAANERFIYTSSKDWISIRAFKDVYIYPDNTWTVINWTLWSAWIFWDQTNWIISVTDGTNWYTIMDKDMWANNVMSYWLLYQRWNNYWFPSSWSLSRTSTIKPNASTYWPWNYYKSNIYITWSNGNSRSDPVNPNLWWYVSFMNQDNDIYVWEWEWENYYYQWWPCSDWFHVPTASEWQWLISIMNTMNFREWYDFSVKLHLPIAWYRWKDTTIYARSSWWFYWTTTPYENIPREIIIARVSYSMDVEARWSAERNWALLIRSFSNEYIQPQSDWTVIHWTLWSAWIFWDQTNWFISVTDWTNWYTISDKNCWATTVYNYWDIMSENNCWCYYQWWNNYWFPFDWTIPNISTSKVDTTWNWPSNPYYSSTYINTNDYNWSETNNNYLRWYKYIERYDHLELYVWDCRDVTLLRWPCPQWWHIPNDKEADVLQKLSQKAHEYLYWHNTWYLLLDWWTLVATNYNVWFVWTSTSLWLWSAWMTSLGKSSSTWSSQYKKRCLPIRPFKDEYVEPDSSWEFIDASSIVWYDTCFIYRKSWYISIELYVSWELWRKITLADKNLWAENLWDAWYYYQWWNNHWRLPWDQPTISTTTVDTTWYWPENRYDNDVYYEINTYSRSYPDNNNLRWSSSWRNSLSSSNVAEVYKWTTLVWTNYKPLTPEAWVYRCAAKWLISMSSDWINWTTISDRNLWANWILWRWLLYQRWNNYWFSLNPSITTTIADATWYWPNNYYLLDKFVRVWDWNTSWDSSNNNNLWWWQTWTNEATRWPCWEWWHIASSSERGNVSNIINSLGSLDEFFDILLFTPRTWLTPMWWYAADTIDIWMNSNFSNTHWDILTKYSNWRPKTSWTWKVKSAWIPIRPFRNEPVIPDDTSRVKVA